MDPIGFPGRTYLPVVPPGAVAILREGTSASTSGVVLYTVPSGRVLYLTSCAITGVGDGIGQTDLRIESFFTFGDSTRRALAYVRLPATGTRWTRTVLGGLPLRGGQQVVFVRSASAPSALWGCVCGWEAAA
jgi:hypothetical protein